MKYSSLIQFDPIVTVIELRSADDKQKARELVRSYVMSDAMADIIQGKILSQLNLEEVVDNKGVLLVGNYGTGKSHLMSLLSSVAADESLLEDVQNGKFKETAKAIAGKFEVLRIEIGSTEMSLRNIITSNIEKDFRHRGLSYQFPDVGSITNNKDALLDMMAIFAQKYDNKGYLIVVDELLDYLKSRRDNELMQDINFMRELGEVIKTSRLRFVSGIQEALFDNPVFHNVSQSILKMKDRYEQALIRSQDVAFVAKQRILHKTPEQKAMIREHLQSFCPLYQGMAEQLDEYIDLFPIHPAYIGTFQRMIIVEKREVLKTISETIQTIINTEVPDKEPGIISYDTYWERIKNDPAKKVEPAIAEVLQKSGVLEDIIKRSFVKAAYKPTALRIIAALSVHRLTTATLDAKLGLTAQNLKDELCIYLPMPELTEEFLLMTVQSVLRDIMTTVSGQFIEYNKDNEQYYLDLRKDVDYDKKIQEKADFLGDDRLNRYFFSVMWDCLDWHPQPYVTGHQIYQYNINWLDKNIFRKGYLFMGTSEDRPTAQPPEDFYAYILPPYDKQVKLTAPQEDEVAFVFQLEPAFTQLLRQYAGAKEMEELSAQGETKSTYAKRAQATARSLQRWMEEHKTNAFKVSYMDVQKPMLEYLRGARLGDMGIKDVFDMCVSRALSECFNAKYPNYPKFQKQITQQNQAEVRGAAMSALAGRPNQLGTATLDSLGLLLNGKVKPENSTYANYYIGLLRDLPESSVLNAADLMQGDSYADRVDKRFKLDAIWTSVLFSALVYGGYCVLVAGDNTRYDAGNVEQLSKASPVDLYDFKRLEKPKAANVEKLRRLCDLAEVNEGLIINPNTWDTAVEELLKKTKELSEKAFQFDAFLSRSSYLWGDSLIPSNQTEKYKEQLKPLRKLSDDIRSRFNSGAKLKNFDYDEAALVAVKKAKETLQILQGAEDFKNIVGDIMRYMADAELMIADKHPLREKFQAQKEAYLTMRDDILELDYDDVQTDDLLTALEGLKAEYIDYYLEGHVAHRLGFKDAQRRQKLLDGPVVAKLRTLSQLRDILPTGQFTDVVNTKLSALKVCYECTDAEMQAQPKCVHCHYSPTDNDPVVTGQLNALEERLDEINEKWREILLGTLSDPMLEERKKFLSADKQPIIATFLQTKKYPDDLQSFCTAVKEVFAEFECVMLNEGDFMEEILSWGTLTPAVFMQKVQTYVDKLTKGKNKDDIRLAWAENDQIDI